MLESMLHPASVFVTLTYSDENLPSDNSVSVREYQLFLKRLRKKLHPRAIRYFFVGEYGDRSGRPHYHAALFSCSLDDAASIAECWGKGHVYLGDISSSSAAYIAGYVTKKWTAKDCPQLLGRAPEFARMSLRPHGIGAGAVPVLAEFFNSKLGAKVLASAGDIPSSLRTGGKSYPLGRYLKGLLRDEIGMENPGLQSPSVHKAVVEMLDLFKGQRLAGSSENLGQVFVRMNEGKILRIETRAKIYSSARTI